MRTLPPRPGGAGLTAAVGGGDSLPTDDVESASDYGMTVAEGIGMGVLMEEARQQPRGEIGSIGLVEEAAPGVGIEAVDAFIWPSKQQSVSGDSQRDTRAPHTRRSTGRSRGSHMEVRHFSLNLRVRPVAE